VEVYKILTKASEPLTVPQIAERFPPGFASAAMTKFREHKEKTDPYWLEGKGARWSDGAKREAMVWYVRRIVRSGIDSSHLTTVSRTQARSGAITYEGTYAANPDHLPTVRMWVTRQLQVSWSLEVEASLSRGHVAGMEFLRRLNIYREKGKHSATETKALLDLAEQAIRKDTSQ
jgi:hypothetical protein